MSIPLNGARILSANGDYVLTQNQSVQGLDFVGVGQKSEGSVEFIFKLPSDNYMNLGEPAGTNVAVPADKMDGLKDITVEAGGKLVKVGSLQKATQTSQPTSKKKWNPTTKRFE